MALLSAAVDLLGGPCEMFVGVGRAHSVEAFSHIGQACSSNGYRCYI